MKIIRQDRSEFNLIFVHSELDDLGLDPHEFRIYAHLARRANGKAKAWPGITSMSESCRMKRNTVIRAIRGLESRGLIRVIRKMGGLSEYLLTAPSEWIKDNGSSADSDTGIPSGTGTGTDTGIPMDTGALQDTGVVSQRVRLPVSKGILKGAPSEGTPLKDNTVKQSSKDWKTPSPLKQTVVQNGGSPDGETAMIDQNVRKEPSHNHPKSSQTPLKRKAYAIAELLQFQHWDNCKVSFVKQTARAYAENALEDGHDEQTILKAHEQALHYCHRLTTDKINRHEWHQHEKASPALTVWLARESLKGDPRTIEQRWQEIISKLTAEKQKAIEEEAKIQREIAEKSSEISEWFATKSDRSLIANDPISAHEITQMATA